MNGICENNSGTTTTKYIIAFTTHDHLGEHNAYVTEIDNEKTRLTQDAPSCSSL